MSTDYLFQPTGRHAYLFAQNCQRGVRGDVLFVGNGSSTAQALQYGFKIDGELAQVGLSANAVNLRKPYNNRAKGFRSVDFLV